MNYILGIFVFSVFVCALDANETGKVKIIPELTERFVQNGDAIYVQCYVTSKASFTGKLEWTKPSVNDVTITKSFEGTHNKFSANLTILSIRPEHLGTYKCAHRNETTTISSASFVLRSPIEDKMTANFTYGDTLATLSCNISGAAASKDIDRIVWLKNDTLVADLPDSKRFTEFPENNTLVIKDPTREDTDLYIARFSFKDMGKPYDCRVEFAGPPLVLNFDKSKNLIEDDKMELQCQVKGYPHATVTWLKNKKVVNNTDKGIILSPLNGYKNARLVIKHVQFDDAGDYTCIAHSDYFNKSDSKFLAVRVKDKLAALWPFLGIVGEVIVLCVIIFVYERKRNKQAENEASNAQDVDGSMTDKKEGLRHRNTQSNNPTA